MGSYFYYSFSYMSSSFLLIGKHFTCFSYLCSHLGTSGFVTHVWWFCGHVAKMWKSQSIWLLSLKYSPSPLVAGPRAPISDPSMLRACSEPLVLFARDFYCVFSCLIKALCFLSFRDFSLVNVHQGTSCSFPTDKLSL